MSPAVEQPAAAAPDAVDTAASEVLQDGELIVLMLRPSGWFVLLVSWPVIAVTGAIALGLILAVRGLDVMVPGPRLAYLIPGLMVIALLRIYLACFQWLRRIYILTNRRIIRIRGYFRTEVFECPLTAVSQTVLRANAGERIFGVGSLLFEIPDQPPDAGAWIHIPRPVEVEEIVAQAIRHAK